jgi:hypothetical protein
LPIFQISYHFFWFPWTFSRERFRLSNSFTRYWKQQFNSTPHSYSMIYFFLFLEINAMRIGSRLHRIGWRILRDVTKKLLYELLRRTFGMLFDCLTTSKTYFWISKFEEMSDHFILSIFE